SVDKGGRGMVRVGGPESWARDVMRALGPVRPCAWRKPTVEWGVARVEDTPEGLGGHRLGWGRGDCGVGRRACCAGRNAGILYRRVAQAHDDRVYRSRLRGYQTVRDGPGLLGAGLAPHRL